MYDAKVLADSIYNDVRLITVEVTFPRFILAEVNTHRVFSRNSASSRAIPPEIQIAKVRENPFVPEAFHERVKGMGQGEAIQDQWEAKHQWILASHFAANKAEKLASMGISKAHVNRVLEPYLWHTAIISSTKWDNFFSLRAPEGDEVDYEFAAQPEFQKAAILMRTAMRHSEPEEVWREDHWHLPLVNRAETEAEPHEVGEGEELSLFWPMVSAGRCARVSFEKQDEYEDPEVSFERAVKLRDAGHLSPFEHVAHPGVECFGISNFDPNWVQLRSAIPHQDNRVGYLDKRGPWDPTETPF